MRLTLPSSALAHHKNLLLASAFVSSRPTNLIPATATTAMIVTNQNNNSKTKHRLTQLLPELPEFHRRLIIVRHGQSDWNQQGLMQGGGFDIPLNETGHEQAQAVAHELSAINIEVLLSSPLQRAVQTASYIGAKTRCVDARVGEMRFGDFEGTAIHGPKATRDNQQRYQAMLQRMKDNVNLKWPGEHGESTHDVATRGQAAVNALLEANPNKSILGIVAHGRFNKILLATLLWQDPRRYTEMEQGNTCINVLDYNQHTQQWNPIVLNYCDHAPNANAKRALQQQQQQQVEAITEEKIILQVEDGEQKLQELAASSQ